MPSDDLAPYVARSSETIEMTAKHKQIIVFWKGELQQVCHFNIEEWYLCLGGKLYGISNTTVLEIP